MRQRLVGHDFNHFLSAVLDLADIATGDHHGHRGFFRDAGNGVGVTEFHRGNNGGHGRIVGRFFHVIKVLLRLVGHVLEHHVFGALAIGQVDGVHQLGKQGRDLADGTKLEAFFAGFLEVTGKELAPYLQAAGLQHLIIAVPALDVFFHEGVLFELFLHVGGGRVGHLQAAHQVFPFVADLFVGIGEVAFLVGHFIPFFDKDAFIHRDFLHLQFFRGDFIHLVVGLVIAGRMDLQADSAKRDQAQRAPERYRICCHDVYSSCCCCVL